MKYRRGWESGLEIDLRRNEFERTGWIELTQERFPDRRSWTL